MDLSEMRERYTKAKLTREILANDPFEQFRQWFEVAREAGIAEPNAFGLATASADGAPSQRIVLLKYFDGEGFVFFTNYGSAKAREIGENPRVSMLFPWVALERQVIISGEATRISAAESLRYFIKRPRESQIGAWISEQSSVVSSRSVLESKFAEMKKRFTGGDITLPSFWGGYRVHALAIEFWQGGEGRIHDRFLYTRAEGAAGAGALWKIERLAP
ncbi:MAG: pyridoxamine 5'-phosphate oxidase [Verrucomicrobiales bacterium]